jgi:hypothetical protein
VGLWSWADLIAPLFLLGPAQGVTITSGVCIALKTMMPTFFCVIPSSIQ